MRVSSSQASILLAIVLDGADQGDGKRVPEERCGLCGSYETRFEASPGLQARAKVAAMTTACVNTDWKAGIPCPMAARAKPLLDALKGATK